MEISEQLQIIEDSFIKTCLSEMERRGWQARAVQSEFEFYYLDKPTTKDEWSAAFSETANRLLRYLKLFYSKVSGAGKVA